MCVEIEREKCRDKERERKCRDREREKCRDRERVCV